MLSDKSYSFDISLKKKLRNKWLVAAARLDSLWHAVILAQEAEIGNKKYEELNDDNPSGMHINVLTYNSWSKCKYNCNQTKQESKIQLRCFKCGDTKGFCE